MGFLIGILTLFLFFVYHSPYASSAPQDIQCEFEMIDSQYTCTITAGRILNDTEELNVLGTHLPSLSAANVTSLRSPLFSDHGVVISVLHSDFFALFPSLEVISLAFTNTTALNLGTECGKLMSLTLYENFLTDIPGGTFSACSKLSTLDLTFNGIATTYTDTFAGLVSLQHVLLNANERLRILNDSFVDSPGVRTFSIGPGSSIEGGALAHMSLLEEITLTASVESFAHCKTLLGGLLKLTLIDLTINPFEDIDFTFFSHFESLTDLQLDSDDIQTIPGGAFLGLNTLTLLSLQYNLIATLESDSFEGLTSLTTLWFAGNQLTHPDSLPFAPLMRLTHLDLSYNPLRSLPDALFAANAQLVELALAGCELEAVNGRIFSPLKALRQLDLSGNLLALIPPDTFVNLPALSVLLMADNRIEALNSNSFRLLPNLTSLNVFQCALDEIEPGFFAQMPQLKVFNAVYNRCINTIVSDVSAIDFESENVFGECFENWRRSHATTIEEETTTPGGSARLAGGEILLLGIFSFFFVFM